MKLFKLNHNGGERHTDQRELGRLYKGKGKHKSALVVGAAARKQLTHEKSLSFLSL